MAADKGRGAAITRGVESMKTNLSELTQDPMEWRDIWKRPT